MKISVASSVFVNYSMADTIRLVAEAGFDGIDIWGGRPHVYRTDYRPDELEDMKKLMQQLGLEPVSMMPAFFRYPHSLSSPNEIVRKDSIDYMYQCMESAVALGARILLIVPGRSIFGQPRVEARKRLIDSIALISQRAQQYNLRLGIEPANTAVTDLVNTADDALTIIQELGFGNLGVVLDSGHIHLSNETPEEAVSKLGSLLLQAHINDNNGLRQQNLVPGDGTFDFAGFIRILRQAGFKGYLTIELAWDYSLEPLPAIRKSIKRLARLLNNKN